MKKALITDDCHPLLRDGLEKLGFVCDFIPDISPEATKAAIENYEAAARQARLKDTLDDIEARFAAAESNGGLAARVREVVLDNRAMATAEKKAA